MIKKWISILMVVCCSLVVFSQEYKPLKSVEDKQEHTILHASTTFGTDYFNNNFSINTFGVDYSKKLDNKTTLYMGANIFNINMNTEELADRSPRRKNTGSMYIGMTYQANDKLIVGGDVFYNGVYNVVGADLNLKFLFSENSYFEISATFARQLSMSGYHQPIPYGYNDIFHPFIFGY